MSVENGEARDYVGLTTDIVSAFVSKNAVSLPELSTLIRAVHTTLSKLAEGPAAAGTETPTPAVPVRRSITPDHLICLEDGKKFKSLKRHLRTCYNLSPDEYRARWNLSADYPMVAPNYAAARSELAKTMGLGQQRRKARGAKAATEG